MCVNTFLEMFVDMKSALFVDLQYFYLFQRIFFVIIILNTILGYQQDSTQVGVHFAKFISNFVIHFRLEYQFSETNQNGIFLGVGSPEWEYMKQRFFHTVQVYV